MPKELTPQNPCAADVPESQRGKSMSSTNLTILYERLSREDERENESVSIENQKSYLEEYAIKNGFKNLVHMTDDGWSGTRWDRPGFQKMMEQVEIGSVDTILIKDMSRLGRDHLRVGLFLEMLRDKGVRLIAVAEAIDTSKGEDDFMPFRNIIAEWHARDTSRKIKAIFGAKTAQGHHVSGAIPSYKCKSVSTTDWNEHSKAEEWRAAWAESVNSYLSQEHVDHRSYARQGIEKFPSVHLGVSASQMEQRGIRTDKGNLNRAIQVTNLKLQQLKTRLVKLQQWLKEEMAKAVLPTLADITGLDKKLEAMVDKQLDISGKLKSVDSRLEVLSEHIRQAGIYLKYKPGYERYKQENHSTHRAEIRTYEAASSYLKAVLNSEHTLPIKAWKAAYSRLTAERSELNKQYASLKNEVLEVEQVRKSVYELLHGEAKERQLEKAQIVSR